MRQECSAALLYHPLQRLSQGCTRHGPRLRSCLKAQLGKDLPSNPLMCWLEVTQGLRASVPCLICLEAALSTLAGLVSPAWQLASPEHAVESLARWKSQSFVTSSQKYHLLNVAVFCWVEASYSERRDYTKTRMPRGEAIWGCPRSCLLQLYIMASFSILEQKGP